MIRFCYIYIQSWKEQKKVKRFLKWNEFQIPFHLNKIKNKPCNVCGKKGKLTCDRCKKIVYCSRNCQFKDWNTHKLKCKAKSISIVVKKNNNVKTNIENVPIKKKKKRILI